VPIVSKPVTIPTRVVKLRIRAYPGKLNNVKKVILENLKIEKILQLFSKSQNLDFLFENLDFLFENLNKIHNF